MRESVRKSPSKVGEVLGPDIGCGATENGRRFIFAITRISARNSTILFPRGSAHFIIHFYARAWSLKSLTEHLWFEVPNRRGFINITPKIEELVQRSGVTEGLCLVNAMHITSSVFINDDEPGLHHDYEVWLEKLAPHAPTSAYRHNRTGEDNADAHLKRQIMGREAVVAITNGKLHFGPWEQIFYGEFDGRRRKRVLVKIIGD
jgi:secondary thiamine-phosphate synthase enzyme